MCITHQYSNQDPTSQRKWVEASGQKVKYQTDVKLRATHCKYIFQDEQPYGQEVYWECETSAIGPPGGKATSFLEYGHGLNKEWELLQFLCDVSLITKGGGGWHTFFGGTDKETKVQGEVKAAQYLRDNLDAYNELCGQFREIMGM
jgi:hypothetical protein